MRCSAALWRPHDFALLKRVWRSGHKFQKARSMAEVAALARVLPAIASIEDWAA